MSTLADRYASALADVAIAQNAAAQIRQELTDFAGLLRESAELIALLGTPAVPRKSKHAVLEALVGRMGASKTLRNFLFVVLDRERVTLLQEIQQAFDAQLDARQGITRASVTSARELDDGEKAQLRGVLVAARQHADLADARQVPGQQAPDRACPDHADALDHAVRKSSG